MELEGKVAVVSGGSRGIGKAIARRLAEEGADVVHIVGGMARTPNPNFTIGGAVNAALANFGKALAGLGLVDDVNLVHPGQTQTERLTEMMADQAARQGKTPDQVLA